MKVEFFLSKLLGPVILILLGLILLISPDSASALVANILGWVLVVAAIGCGIAALVSPAKRFGKVASAIIFAAAGGWLRAHPLMLAATIGRFCGLFLWISSIQNIRLNKKLGRRGILPWVNAVVGLALIIFRVKRRGGRFYVYERVRDERYRKGSAFGYCVPGVDSYGS